MKVDNPLSREYLELYPQEAARVLEQVSAEHVASLFRELNPKLIAPVLIAMLPQASAKCLNTLEIRLIVQLLSEIPIPSSARIYRLLLPAKQDELSPLLSDKVRGLIKRHLSYPPASAGALMNQAIDVLPENITVSEALRRIDHLDHPVNCNIYIIDDKHLLTGAIGLGKLMKSNDHARLRDIMNRKIPSVSVNTDAEKLKTNPLFSSHQKLPVVERDGTLSGELDYSHVQEATASSKTIDAHDPLELFTSLAGLYWLSVAQFLDNLFGGAGQTRKEDQS